ncbi:MAG: hypothetical protein WAM92_17100, partial [Mycobacterium sp.]
PTATTPPAPAKGLGIAAGAKRPGAKKSAPPPAQRAPAAEPKTEPAQPEPTGDDESSPPAAPAKGLGIARGAKPPGKR